jgi:hypothetical protein
MGPLRGQTDGGWKEQGLLIEKTFRQAKKPPSGPAPTRWMIARHDANGRLVPLCVRGAGVSRILPIFSFEEEARMFLRLGDYEGSRWQARASCAGELVSVLCGPCSDAKGVALDPLPEMLKDGTVELVLVGRRRFLGQLLAGGWKRAAARDARGPHAEGATKT